MIEDLLDATRLQAGQMSFKPSEINLANLASEAVRRFAAQLPSHEIEVNFPPDLPLVIADAARIHQVLDNLISNAIKYSPKGKIVVSGKRDGEQLVVCVSDSGKDRSARPPARF